MDNHVVIFLHVNSKQIKLEILVWATIDTNEMN